MVVGVMAAGQWDPPDPAPAGPTWVMGPWAGATGPPRLGAERAPDHWVGVDVGGTNVRAGAVDEAGRVLSWVSYPHLMSPGQFHAIPEAAGMALDRAGLAWADVAAVGVGIAGLVDSLAGLVVDARQPGMARPGPGTAAFGAPGRAGSDRKRRVRIRRARELAVPAGRARLPVALPLRRHWDRGLRGPRHGRRDIPYA